ncbi:8c6e0674-9b75-4862-9d27-81e8812c6163 [Sclerotinia trifoliorum]|uniref:8c6e0674-9b75-4862-9d27-81e8812c6163 n=1 Tax=Sclerotinia trifoliorum TaxID=28548 RepID=A0A8H2VL51_9HELO|nr:8c6e0674-9b75-4862-9d27-81e8812c6163 [Sclerotinia trifoliorum]
MSPRLGTKAGSKGTISSPAHRITHDEHKMVSLPGDILLQICEELGTQLEFGVLFNCAIAGKQLVGSALQWLYRSHNEYLRIISSEGEAPEWSKIQGRNSKYNAVSKWALSWQSVVRSSLGATAYPYCLYIRSLDLTNLSNLLEDGTFRMSAMDNFFADEMAKFLSVDGAPRTRTKRGPQVRLNTTTILNLIGESITKYVSDRADEAHTTVVLENLSGDITSVALPGWVGRLSRLKSMTIWDGKSLNENVAAVISNKCPNFDEIRIFVCSDDTDRNPASFIKGLRHNSLLSLEVLSNCKIGPAFLSALNHHCGSLKSLKLQSLNSEAIKNLNILQSCTALEILDLEDSQHAVDLEATENDVFLETVEWLGHCEKLRELVLNRIVCAPAILKQICLRNNIRLERLVVTGPSLVNDTEFHRAISHQTELEVLELRGGSDEVFRVRDDIDNLLTSICQLTKLKELTIVESFEYFSSNEIKRLARSLPLLEKFHFSGYGVGDEILPYLSNLHNLRDVSIAAISSFTLDGLLSYVSTLRDTNQGLVLSVMSQNSDQNLAPLEQQLVREGIIAKVDGKFDFALLREVAESEFDSASD